MEPDVHRWDPTVAPPTALAPRLSVRPPPGAPAEVLVQLRADRRADVWVPAFERDRVKVLDGSRPSFSLTPSHDIARIWQLRLAAAPAVDEYMGSGRDETGFVDLGDVFGARR
ncbi:DUF6247 family protein [Streptomyces sp. NPDC058664]|uniref:DUF6247 family protein n=1 Tax=unclassified Streptomyces TaxID=2593676 RepID=UPI003647D13B